MMAEEPYIDRLYNSFVDVVLPRRTISLKRTYSYDKAIGNS
jgi:hypothetical protein